MSAEQSLSQIELAEWWESYTEDLADADNGDEVSAIAVNAHRELLAATGLTTTDLYSAWSNNHAKAES